MCLALHSRGIRFPPKEKGGFSWRAAGTFIFSFSCIYSVSCNVHLKLLINGGCSSLDAGLTRYS